MKKFRFRLERVLQFRNVLKKEKERELALKTAELHSAEEELEEIITTQDKAGGPREGEMTMAELTLLGDYYRYLQEALVNQRLLVLEATEAVEMTREAYIEKAVEAETLETLKDKKKEQHRQDQRKEERKELDKLTVQRFRFSTKKA